ncbi:hypothetical protein MKZ38_004837 [Zalerion maritima]|uniref:Uncharacterized protein n=1 Tax=Zalerion maritima TaxID=339359 RepID=A0AAD5WPB0_9PEZI|nr:hypothetical protein MKZ38_004837 [Zalerion maritima]
MQGSAMRNLYAFKRLCGSDGMKNVALGTTFWDEVDEAVGAEREEQLRASPDLWGKLVDNGAKVRRVYNGDRPDVLELLLELSHLGSFATKLQQEIVDNRADPDETSAMMAAKGKEIATLENGFLVKVDELSAAFQHAVLEQREEHKMQLEEERFLMQERQSQRELREQELREVQQRKTQQIEEQIRQLSYSRASERSNTRAQRVWHRQQRKTLESNTVWKKSPGRKMYEQHNDNLVKCYCHTCQGFRSRTV